MNFWKAVATQTVSFPVTSVTDAHFHRVLIYWVQWSLHPKINSSISHPWKRVFVKWQTPKSAIWATSSYLCDKQQRQRWREPSFLGWLVHFSPSWYKKQVSFGKSNSIFLFDREKTRSTVFQFICWSCERQQKILGPFAIDMLMQK